MILMNKKLILSVCLLFFGLLVLAQQPGSRSLRIVDSLTAKETAERNPVLLKAELDSLLKAYAPAKQDLQQTIIPEKDNSSTYILSGIVLLVLISGGILMLLYDQRRKMRVWSEMAQQRNLTPAARTKNGKKQVTAFSLEEKIDELNAELNKLSKENEGLSRVINEYNGIQHEYDSLKHGMQKAYKIRNYPGYDKEKKEAAAMQSVLETENALALYAYEKFLKPVLTIADANKNNPAKIPAADRDKLLDLLISLSFLYIEYLYLRVNDLSVGGNMVERIRSFTKGSSPDPVLLKKLNTDSGSRALVIRLALNKALVANLSYPVFDETNLNYQ
jgi:hypothetical protein